MYIHIINLTPLRHAQDSVGRYKKWLILQKNMFANDENKNNKKTRTDIDNVSNIYTYLLYH